MPRDFSQGRVCASQLHRGKKCFISDSAARISAMIRAKYRAIKLADALQLAVAIDCNCDCFLTDDKRLGQVREVKVLLLDDIPTH